MKNSWKIIMLVCLFLVLVFILGKKSPKQTFEEQLKIEQKNSDAFVERENKKHQEKTDRMIKELNRRVELKNLEIELEKLRLRKESAR